jgi:hypothetical protein
LKYLTVFSRGRLFTVPILDLVSVSILARGIQRKTLTRATLLPNFRRLSLAFAEVTVVDDPLVGDRTAKQEDVLSGNDAKP